MRIAISIRDGLIPPVFDTSRRLLLVDYAGGREISRSEEPLEQAIPAGIAAGLQHLGVEVLLCGAISRQLSWLIGASGITLVPFLTGSADEILRAYLDGKLPEPRYLMPGCCGRRRQFRGRHFSRFNPKTGGQK